MRLSIYVEILICIEIKKDVCNNINLKSFLVFSGVLNLHVILTGYVK